LLESDLKPYLDTDIVDRSPFYQFRSKLINLKQVLHQQRLHMMENTKDIMEISEEKQSKREESKEEEGPKKPSILSKLFSKK